MKGVESRMPMRNDLFAHVLRKFSEKKLRQCSAKFQQLIDSKIREIQERIDGGTLDIICLSEGVSDAF